MSSFPVPEPVIEDTEFDPFVGGSVERVISTTEAQREVWLADKLSVEASLAFNESVSLRLGGLLDVGALRAALDGLLARHASLRSTVGPEAAELLVGTEARLELPVVDLQAATPQERERVLAFAPVEAVQLPFDLERGPLFRAALYRSADDEHLLLLTAHHIVCDGWSWGLITDDLGALYAEQIGAGPSPDPADDYAAYVAWETAEATGPAHGEHERFWLGRFAGSSLPVLELPLDRPRPPQRTFTSRRTDQLLDADLVGKVKQMGGKLGASLFATLFSAFAATLHRITAQTDLVVGVPSAGQSASGLHHLVGHCVNLLPIRVAVDPGARFDAFTQQTRSDLLDAFDHQAMTYGALLTKLPVRRDPSRLPLVSVMFNVDQAVKSEWDSFPELSVELNANARRYENFELFVNIAGLSDGGLRLECQYNTDLFDDATVRRWLRSYRALLESAVRDASQPVGSIAWMAAQDLAAVHALQPAVARETRSGLMHSAFVRQCAAQADRVACRHGDRTVSYRELDQRSNRLARALRARGIRRGDRVGLCLSRDLEMVAALLGVIKAGASYVPLDPGFPPARLAYYAEDAQLALLLTESSLTTAPTAWRSDAADRVLQLDADASWLDESAEPLAASSDDAAPQDTAYVIYTSGSTGKPKGVCVPHRAVTNFLDSMQREPGIRPQDRLAAVTTLSFDIAVLELMLPLSVGAEVLIVPRDTAIDGASLGRLLASSGATMMQATPGMWRALVDAQWPGASGFKALVGGESLPADLATALLARADEVWNLYGPTETTVWSTAWRVEQQALDAGGVSIGLPIDNTTVWIVDAAGQLCPVGIPGEICIGGHGVTLGYLERPELTADRFVADVFSERPGATMYRTGDRGRWRNDGLLEHLGRLDFQVKVRGYRIELGEIEAACSDWPGVSQCVVLAREDDPGDVRLVAYVTLAPGVRFEEAAFRVHLKARLPDYMLPQHVMPLDALPRLPNGKIDRKALPAPQHVPAASAGARVAPRTDLEKTVAAAMESVLKLPGLGVHDDFFAMGGHSLLAARLTSQLNRALGLTLSLRTLFDSPTAERLAVAVERAQGLRTSTPTREPIRHHADRRSAPLTPMQERIRFVEELHPGRVVYNTPSGHLLTGPMDVDKFRLAFCTIIQRQPALRTFVGVKAARLGYEQVIAESVGDDVMPCEDLSSVPLAQRRATLFARMQALVDLPMDIYRPPLFRAVLYKLAEEEHAFFFMPHHFIWDGWSFDLLYEEMAAVYGALVSGRPNPLPPLAVTFGDYSQWFCGWLASAEHEAQLGYWKDRFARAPVPKAPAPDHPRRAGMTGVGATEAIKVDAVLTEQLREVARGADATLNMLTMALYTVMLARVIETSAIVVAVPVRGRMLAEVEPVMGFFNNLLPVPLAVDPNTGMLDFVRGLKSDLLDVFSHQDVPFEQIAAEPAIAARSHGAGLYQALFSFQDARERQRQWGPLAHEPLTLFQKGATEDLGLWLLDLPGGLAGGFTYNADLYEQRTAAAFRTLYLELANRLAANPQLTIRELAFEPASGAAAYLQRLAAGAVPVPLQRSTTASASGPAPATLSAAEHVVAQAWGSVLGIDPTQLVSSDRFFSLGGTSLMAMRAVALLEEHFGQRLPSSSFIDDPTIGSFAKALAEGRVGESLVTIRRGGTAKPLFLVHDGEGETLLYRNLANRLSTDRTIFGLQPAASKDSALLHATRSEMVAHYLRVIREVQPHGPYFLGGLCAGGTLAFEVARLLQKENETVGLLALIDANHPTARRKAGRTTKQRLDRMKQAMHQTQAMSFGESLKHRTVQITTKTFHALKYEVGLRAGLFATRVKASILRVYVDRQKPAPEALRRLTFPQLYETVENDLDPAATLKGTALLVRATVGTGEQVDEPFIDQYADPSFGWRQRVGELRIIDVPGGHVSLLQEPHVAALAEQLQAHLDQPGEQPSAIVAPVVAADAPRRQSVA